MKIFSLFGEILVDNETAKAGLDEIDKKSEASQGKLDKLIGVAGNVALSVAAIGTAAVAALGMEAIGAADDFNKAMNNLSAQTGVTGEEMAQFEDIATRIYNNNLGESFDDIASAMSEVRRTTMASGEELEKLTSGALTLRDTFDMDVQSSVNTANSLMANFGVTGEEAYNLIAQGAQMGANKNGDLLDTLNEYAPQFQALGFSAEEFTDILIDGATNGSFSIDKVGDAIKEFTIRSKDLSATSLDAFQSLGLNGQQMSAAFASGGESAQQAFQQVMSALSNVKDPLEQNRIGVELFGTQWEDLEASAVLSMANVEAATDRGRNTLEQINSVKYDSFGEAMQGIGRQLETGILIPLGQAVLPLLNEFANWLSINLPIILQWFRDTFTGSGDSLSTFGKLWTWLKDEIIMPVMDWAVPFIEETLGKIQEYWSENSDEIEEAVDTVMKFIEETFDRVFPYIQEIVESTVDIIGSTISGLVDVVTGVIKLLNGLFTGDWKKAWEGAKQIFEGIWNSLEGIIRGVLNIMINNINYLIRGLNKIQFNLPDWVPGVGGKSFGINISEIPKLAVGTDFFKGGLAIVGEQGPELVEMERGAKVHTNSETRQMLNGLNGGFTVQINNPMILNERDADRLGDLVVGRLRTLGVVT